MTSIGDDGHLPPNAYHTRVRAHQTDLNGAMYHGAFFDVFDDARIETFRRLGYTYQDLLEDRCAAVIRRIESDFRAPARMDDMLSITVFVAAMSAATMTLRYECRRDRDILALAHATFAFVDLNGKARRIPPGLRRVVQDHARLLAAPT
ncbi:MAG: acyl-CoA thioesterase [Chloroflexi bacterium]|nr:acyl-CoA thioesterase [Chloroflexota bacterium]